MMAVLPLSTMVLSGFDPWTPLLPVVVQQAPYLLPALLLVLAAGACAYRYWWARCQDRLHHEARMITVLPGPSVESAGAHALWAHLAGLQPPWFTRLVSGTPHLSWEILMTEHETQIRMWVPGSVPAGLVEHAIQAAWPGAHTRTEASTPALPVPDTASRVPLVHGGHLRLAHPDALPIRTRFDDEDDPLRAVLTAATGLQAQEAVCVQLLARPVTGRASRTTTEGPGRVAPGLARLLGELLDLLTPTTSSTRRGPQQQRPPEQERARLETSARNRAIVEKRRGSHYQTLLRYAVSTTIPTDHTRQQQQAAHSQLRGRAHAIASAFSAYVDHNAYQRHRLRHPLATLNSRRLGRADVLSVPELACVAHLPDENTTAGLARAGAQTVTPSPALATSGRGVKTLGTSDTGQPRQIGLRVADARHHLHVLGATGSGKSTLLARMILDDATAGRGVVLLDPKGDLASDVRERLPQRAAEKLVVFDADQPDSVPCLNPLQGGDTDLVVDNLTAIFRRVYAGFWGPRTDDVFRAACLTLRAQHGTSTLADLPRLLTEPAFRARLTAGLTETTLSGFWRWYEDLSEASRAQIVAPLMNKLRAFLLRPFVHRALATGQSTVDLTRVLDHGGMCLVRIPKGSLGNDTTRLLGSLLVAQVWQATTARAGTPPEDRRDASLVLDECQNFLHLPFPLEDLLAEARGFRLSLTLAHQHLGQLDRDLREGIASNARNKIFFTTSPADARELAHHTQPRLSDYDLRNLDAFHAAARLVAHHGDTPACTLTTDPLAEPNATPRASSPTATGRDTVRPDPPAATGHAPTQAQRGTATPAHPASAHETDEILVEPDETPRTDTGPATQSRDNTPQSAARRIVDPRRS